LSVAVPCNVEAKLPGLLDVPIVKFEMLMLATWGMVSVIVGDAAADDCA
jgi:hypothetical protein